MRRLLPALVVVLGLGLLVWALPELARWWSASPPALAPREPSDPTAVDAFVAQALDRVGADDVLASEEREGVRRQVLRLSPGVDAVKTGEQLARSASDAGIEAYSMSTDGLDAELRVYAGARLRSQVLLVPDLSGEQKPPRTATLRERPLVALVVTGLGDADLTEVLELPLPLSVAIRPWRPFSLRLAREALRHHKEILAHLPEGDAGTEALGAIPWASGMVLDSAPGPELPSLSFGVVVYRASLPGRRLPTGLRGLPAQVPGRLGVSEAIARTRALANRRGSATLCIDVEDPDLGKVLSWASRAHLEGFRLALASEAARPEDVRGQPSLAGGSSPDSGG